MKKCDFLIRNGGSITEQSNRELNTTRRGTKIVVLN